MRPIVAALASLGMLAGVLYAALDARAADTSTGATASTGSPASKPAAGAGGRAASRSPADSPTGLITIYDSSGPALLSSAAADLIGGDANGDGTVDMSDYAIWFNNFRATGADWTKADFNGDGVVDMTDYAIWFNNFRVTAATGLRQVSNVKVVTDATPDYYDMPSMISSITANWPATKDKCWALFYWNHIARRQTSPMILHGTELTDPIRQFNDYGYTQCSTISGVNCGIWGTMGLPVKFWDISNHTVPEVYYDGRYHCYDNSMSAIYTLCDGTTIAGVQDIGANITCTSNPPLPSGTGHIALQHCLHATSPNGFLTGADTMRPLSDEATCFYPAYLKYRDYYNNWDIGHRYILNLREKEVYTRSFKLTGTTSAFYVPNAGGSDPEAANTRYHIRANGAWAYSPVLTAAEVAKYAHQITDCRAMAPSGIQPAGANKAGEIVFKIDGGNVICSGTIHAGFTRATANDLNVVLVSTTNGLGWTEVWRNSGTGATSLDIPLLTQVNGAYEVLVKVQLLGKSRPADAALTSISFDTITMLNSKTQPRLRLGANTVYVGTGDPAGSIVFWPDLQGTAYKKYVVDEANVATAAANPGYMGTMYAAAANTTAHVTFRADAPDNITKITYGGRLYNRATGAHIDFFHSFDNGVTWTKSYSLTSTATPWDVIHYETVSTIPAGVKSVLYKFAWNASSAGSSSCSIYALRMETNYRVTDPSFKPIEVTFAWRERQNDYSTLPRSHTQLVPQVPYTYTVNVGGVDHPVMDSLKMNLQGAVPNVTYGYSDGRDVGGAKFQDRWVTYGNILSLKKSYTCTVPSGSNWGAWDDGTRLTDGIVGPPYCGGTEYSWGPLWQGGQKPDITVDLGSSQSCGAFRIHVSGYPFWDAMKGEVLDKVEVQTSPDNTTWTSRGFFDFNLRWKNIAANHMWTDEETFMSHVHELILSQAVNARYVKFKLTPAAGRFMSVTEVQVLDSIRYDPFDLKLKLPG